MLPGLLWRPRCARLGAKPPQPYRRKEAAQPQALPQTVFKFERAQELAPLCKGSPPCAARSLTTHAARPRTPLVQRPGGSVLERHHRTHQVPRTHPVPKPSIAPHSQRLARLQDKMRFKVLDALQQQPFERWARNETE